MDELKTLRELAEKATRGPWRYWPCKDGSYKDGTDYAQIASGRKHVAQVRIQSVTKPDMDYIAATNPAVILSLLDRLEKAEQALQRAQTDTPTAFAMLPSCTCFSEQQEKYCLRQRKCSKAVAQLDKQET